LKGHHFKLFTDHNPLEKNAIKFDLWPKNKTRTTFCIAFGFIY
jgi:hypothetical protein